ncbi:MAG: NgoFVII family restriction endonuclease, partial [Chloroflexi bacterium]|nr:NgoFVII family restriction endonuclease [Chloroflexota bacterium]
MLTNNLFDEVLINPAKSGANQLYIVSGYATPAIIYKHLQTIRDELRTRIELKLIVGMTPLEGVAKAYHQQFQKLVTQDSKRQFECWYMTKFPPVHAKTYTWYQSGLPNQAFTGSANYSHNGFFKQWEAVASDDPAESYAYFQFLLGDAISCLDSRVEQIIRITDVQIRRARQIARQKPVTALPRGVSPEVLATQPVRISLLDNKGNLP